MKVLLTGASGQLGQAIINSLPIKVNLIKLFRNDLDLTDFKACKKIVHTLKPDWVINAGAYTAVDKAESQPELAFAINAGAPKAFAEALTDIGGSLLQISTDFVFNGNQGFPYKVNQPVNPLGVYGSTKATGEKEALRCPHSYVIRTSWLYSSIGNNFLLTMLKLHASKASLGDSLNVVSDQFSCPTSTYSLSLACWNAIGLKDSEQNNRILHWCDAGVASWYDFAVAIGELGVEKGLLLRSAVVNPISTSQYPTPAKRPCFSLLDCMSSAKDLGLSQEHWRCGLAKVLENLHASSC